MDKKKSAISLITVLMRLCVGMVFVYSGFVKGVDPWGTIYKMTDYMSAMGLSVPSAVVVVGTFVLIVIEFLCGAFMVLGCYRRIAVWIASAIMSVMLPLTAWIVITDPVPDCGCFGDALILSNSATFLKNILLTAGQVWLIIYNKRVRPYIAPSIQWIELVSAGGFILVVSLYGYNYQPAIDYRPYKVGESMLSQDEGTEAEYAFVYTKDNKEQQFDIENVPDESEDWKFVRRQLVKAAEAPKDGKLLAVYDSDSEDVSDEVLDPEGPELLVLYPTLDNFNISATYRINSLYDYCKRRGINVVAIVSATPEQLAYFDDVAMPSYPIYTAEDAAIKSVARGCPALVYIQDGVVQWKAQLKDIDFAELPNNPNPLSLYTDYGAMLPWAICILLLLSMLLVVGTMLTKKKPNKN